MIKKAKVTKKDNVVNFPTKINDLDKEIEATIFAAAEPLDVDTIESKISKKTNVVKSLEK
jgi:segregation and condensation protein B